MTLLSHKGLSAAPVLSGIAPVEGVRELLSFYAWDRPEANSVVTLKAAVLNAARACCDYQFRATSESLAHLRLLGFLATWFGHFHVGLACLARGARTSPHGADDLIDLGDALRLAGDHVRATSAYLRALRLTRDNIALYERLGLALARQRRPLEAVALFKEALRLHPDRPGLHCRIGEAFQMLGRESEAIRYYETGVRLAPDDVEAYRHLGRVRLIRKEWQLADSYFRSGLKIDERDADLHVGLGQSLLGTGRCEEAIHEFRTALALNPSNLHGLQFLVLALEILGRLRESSAAWLGLGVALEKHGRFDEAAAAYRATLARKKDSLRAMFRLGVVRMEAGRPHEAVRHFESVVALDPGHTAAHVHLGAAYHLTGDSRRGWQELAWLCHPHDLKWRSFEQPLWDGSALEGRTILLWTRPHSGLGDAIQLLRYASLLKARGATVALECQKEMIPLAKRVSGVDIVVGRGVPLPPFDVHAPLGLVAVRIHAKNDAIPADVPYISIDDHFRERWRQRLRRTDQRTIGLVWGATPRPGSPSRCISLSALRPLGAVPGTRLVSLQLGLQADELLSPLHGLPMLSLLDESCSLVDTAALIQGLDLVITVDTMVAHLAGALAKPVWTLLPYAADWRWFSGGRTPWYPTMRLFRQVEQGNWNDVVRAVRTALEHL